MQMAIPTCILFATHLLGGVAAFGSTLLALPLILLIGWDLRPAVALLVIVGLVQSLQVASLTWRGADLKTLLRILVVAGIGIPIGFAVAGVLPERGLGIFLGLLLIAAGASRPIERWTRKECRLPLWLLNALLLTGGVMHGAFGSGGVTLTVYGRYALKDKSAFRGTLSVMWSFLNVLVLFGLVKEGSIGREVILSALPGVPAVMAATWLGHRVAGRLSQEKFADTVGMLLCIAGVLTVGRNIA
jgi:uncharacterized membrane protein YfcA